MKQGLERTQRSMFARIRPFWFILLVIALAAGAAGYWVATYPGFALEHVRVRGNRVVPASLIVQRAQLNAGQNVWLQNIGEAARRVATIPYVRDVTIRRRLAADVEIDVTERVPYARVRLRGTQAVVDRDLRVLEYTAPPRTLPLLIATSSNPPAPGAFLRESGVERLAADYRTLQNAGVHASTLSLDRFGDLVAQVSGVQLLLGEDSDLQGKAALVEPIFARVQSTGKRIAQLDLRAPSSPVVRYR